MIFGCARHQGFIATQQTGTIFGTSLAATGKLNFKCS